MKHTKKYLTRLLVIFSSLVMLLSTVVAMPISAGAPASDPILSGTEYGITYEDGVYTLSIDAERLAELLASPSFNKETLMSIMPESVYNLIINRDKEAIKAVISELIRESSIGELKNDLPIYEFFTKEELLDLISIDELLKLIDIEAIIDSLEPEEIENIFVEEKLDELLDSVDLSGILTKEKLQLLIEKLEADENFHLADLIDQDAIQGLIDDGVIVLSSFITPEVIEKIFDPQLGIIDDDEIEDMLNNDSIIEGVIKNDKVLDSLLQKSAFIDKFEGNADIIHALVADPEIIEICIEEGLLQELVDDLTAKQIKTIASDFEKYNINIFNFITPQFIADIEDDSVIKDLISADDFTRLVGYLKPEEKEAIGADIAGTITDYSSLYADSGIVAIYDKEYISDGDIKAANVITASELEDVIKAIPDSDPRKQGLIDKLDGNYDNVDFSIIKQYLHDYEIASMLDDADYQNLAAYISDENKFKIAIDNDLIDFEKLVGYHYIDKDEFRASGVVTKDEILALPDHIITDAGIDATKIFKDKTFCADPAAIAMDLYNDPDFDFDLDPIVAAFIENPINRAVLVRKITEDDLRSEVNEIITTNLSDFVANDVIDFELLYEEEIIKDEMIRSIVSNKDIETILNNKIIKLSDFVSTLSDENIKALIKHVNVSAIPMDTVLEVFPLDDLLDLVLEQNRQGFIDALDFQYLIQLDAVQSQINSLTFDDLKNIVDFEAIKDKFVGNFLTDFGYIYINDTYIYSKGSLETGKIDVAKTEYALLDAIPTFDKIVNVGDDGIVASLVFRASINNKEYSFGFKIKLDGDTTNVKAYAQKMLNRFSFEVEPDGAINTNVKLPAKIADLYISTINRNDIPVAIRAKLDNIANESVEDLTTEIIEKLSVSEIKDLLEKVDIGKIDDKLLEQLEVNKSQAQIILDYVVKAVNKAISIAESSSQAADMLSKPFSEFYTGNGTFELGFDFSYDPVKLAEKVRPIPSNVKEMIQNTEIEHQTTTTITFEGLYKVSYIEDGNTVYTAFRTKGYDLTKIEPDSDDGWGDTDGKAVTVMPARDIELAKIKYIEIIIPGYDEPIKIPSTELSGGVDVEDYLEDNDIKIPNHYEVGTNSNGDFVVLPKVYKITIKNSSGEDHSTVEYTIEQLTEEIEALTKELGANLPPPDAHYEVAWKITLTDERTMFLYSFRRSVPDNIKNTPEELVTYITENIDGLDHGNFTIEPVNTPVWYEVTFNANGNKQTYYYNADQLYFTDTKDGNGKIVNIPTMDDIAGTKEHYTPTEWKIFNYENNSWESFNCENNSQELAAFLDAYLENNREGNFEVKAGYTPIWYKVIFEADGNTVTELYYNAAQLYFTDTNDGNGTRADIPGVGDIPDNKNHYTPAEWIGFDCDDDVSLARYLEKYLLDHTDGNCTITAKYDPIWYKVIFDANGTLLTYYYNADKPYLFNTTAENATNVNIPTMSDIADTKKHFTPTGWIDFTDDAGLKAFLEAYLTDNSNGNFTVKADYTPVWYEVTFKANNDKWTYYYNADQLYFTDTKDGNGKIVNIPTMDNIADTKNHFTPTGWIDFTDDAGLKAFLEAYLTNNSNGNFTVEADYTPIWYEVTFDANDETRTYYYKFGQYYLSETKVDNAPKVNIPSVFNDKAHCDRDGWLNFTNDEGLEAYLKTHLENNDDGDFTVFAKYKPKEYTLKFIDNDGLVFETTYDAFERLPSNDLVDTLTIRDVIPHYDPNGWDFGDQGNLVDYLTFVDYDHVTIYANPYKPTEYTVSVEVGGTTTPLTYTVESIDTLIANLESLNITAPKHCRLVWKLTVSGGSAGEKFDSIEDLVEYIDNYLADEDNTHGNFTVEPINDPIKYTVTFKNGDNVVATLYYNSASGGLFDENGVLVSALPAVPGQNGSWKVTVNGEKVDFTFENSIEFLEDYLDKNDDGSFTVEAVYKTPDEPDIPELEQYKITFVDRDGKVFGTVIFTVETDPETIKAPLAIPYAKGYNVFWPEFDPFDEDRFEETGSYDLKVEAVYKAIEYKITFVDENGNVFGETKFTVETDPESITAPTELPKAVGYNVSWPEFELFDNERFEETGSYNLTVEAVYEAIEYKITFTDKYGNVFGTVTFNVETDPSSIKAPVAVPYAVGYNVSWPAFDPFDDERFEETGSYDLTVKAVYEAIEYKITFTDKDGNVFGETKFTVETDPESITAPSELPEAVGYNVSWPEFELFDDERFEETDSYDLTVEAVYEAIEYKITFVDENGNVIDEFIFTVETDPESITAPSELPQKIGYNVSWPEFELLDDKRFEETGSYDLTVEAVYEAIEYKITFTDKDGNVIDEFIFTVETDPESITAPSELPVANGYNVSWPEFKLFNDERFEETGSYDLTVEAVYETIEYKITFVDKDGNVYGEHIFTVETDPESITSPTDIPEAAGYNVSWPEFELLDDQRFEDTGSYDLTVKAAYDPIQYVATFKVNGEVFKEIFFTVETQSLEDPTIPAKNGYTAAWSKYTLGTADITIEAVYTVIEYRVVFLADGLEVGILTYTVEDNKIKEPTVPKKDGYIGVWEAYTLDGGDKEIHAIYTPVEDIDDGSTAYWWTMLGILAASGIAAAVVYVVITKKKSKKN